MNNPYIPEDWEYPCFKEHEFEEAMSNPPSDWHLNLFILHRYHPDLLSLIIHKAISTPTNARIIFKNKTAPTFFDSEIGSNRSGDPMELNTKRHYCGYS